MRTKDVSHDKDVINWFETHEVQMKDYLEVRTVFEPPVSYTHLDVYKRQALRCKPPAALVMAQSHGQQSAVP